MAPKTVAAPIYNATYTLFRLSPLYVPNAAQFWNEDNLNFHAKRLADSLQGDNLKTVTTAIEEADETVTRAGPFKRCVWRQLKQAGSDDEEEARSADNLGILDGLQVDIEYERASYIALLLRGVNAAQDDLQDEIKLPLVFLRMPAVIRASFTNYLATVFDTRTEPLQLGSAAICKSLENFLDECKESEDSFVKIVKEIQLTLSFSRPIAPSLKAIDVAIAREDVPGFLSQGQAINATSVETMKSVNGVFMAALRKYLQKHIALDISVQQVIISRVACGAFALGREGKVKLFAPGESTDDDGDYDTAAMASRTGTARILQVILETAIGNT